MVQLSRKPVHEMQRNNARSVDSYRPLNMLDTLSVRTLLEKVQDGCLAIDASGVVRFINQSAERLLGVAQAEAQGRPLLGLFTLLDSKTQRPINKPLAYLLARTGAGSSGSCELLMRRDGAMIPFDYSISPLCDGKRSTSRLVLLMLRDASRTYARIEQLVEAVRHDEHTRLLRRGELERRLGRVLKTMSDGDHHALLFMDLDHFKAINDNAGHAAGDRVLIEVAELFRTQVRERDTLARLGGDEFGLLLEHCPPAQASERALALHSAITNHVFEVDSHRFTLGVSIGIASIRRTQLSIGEVMSAADTACYAAKRRQDAVSPIEELIVV